MPTDSLKQRDDMMNVDDELRRRRERGRRSQAAFRKRQARVAQDLTDHNRRLQVNIQQVVNATRGDERPDLLDTIRDLAEAAGIDATKLDRSGLGEYTGVEDISIDTTTKDFVLRSSDQPNHEPGPASLNLSTPQRVNCGVWIDPLHYMRLSLPPEDIIPYLGPGSKTFAGRLFWSIMEHSQVGCEFPHREPAALIQTGLGHSKTTRDVGIPFIRDMVEARLEYKRTGSISQRYSAAGEADLGMVVNDQVKREYRARGKDPGLWLSCVAIEERLKMMISNALFSLLEKAARGEGDPTLRDLLVSIKCRLCDTGACFGDGPRWSVDVVDGLFLEWIRKAVVTTFN